MGANSDISRYEYLQRHIVCLFLTALNMKTYISIQPTVFAGRSSGAFFTTAGGTIYGDASIGRFILPCHCF